MNEPVASERVVGSDAPLTSQTTICILASRDNNTFLKKFPFLLFFFCCSQMLQRQLRSALLHNHARRIHPIHPRIHPFVAHFHSSRCSRNEVPKSPFQTFVDVLKEELRKNREWQESVKQLQGDVDKFQDSEAMKKARAAYERARVRISFP
jgi:hypothetical protein